MNIHSASIHNHISCAGLLIDDRKKCPSPPRPHKLGEEKKAAMDMVSKVNLKALNAENDVRYLSGGNQQKVVISKWLYKDSEIFIFDEPTRGIDVNTKAEIYSLMVDMVRDGKAIIMVSSRSSSWAFCDT